MRNSVVYEGSTPVEVQFPLSMTVDIENGSKARIDRNAVYEMLGERSQNAVCDRLWELEFIEDVEVFSDGGE